MFLIFFIQERVNQTYTITSLLFQVSKMGLTNFFISSGFYFKSKVLEASYKGKNMFFNIWVFFLKFLRL